MIKSLWILPLSGSVTQVSMMDGTSTMPPATTGEGTLDGQSIVREWLGSPQGPCGLLLFQFWEKELRRHASRNERGGTEDRYTRTRSGRMPRRWEGFATSCRKPLHFIPFYFMVGMSLPTLDLSFFFSFVTCRLGRQAKGFETALSFIPMKLTVTELWEGAHRFRITLTTLTFTFQLFPQIHL